MNHLFETGPIRPPSEAYSILLRITRNCPWNRCAFCSTYRDREFSRRTVEEVKADIDAMHAIALRIAEASERMGLGGRISEEVISEARAEDPRPGLARPHDRARSGYRTYGSGSCAPPVLRPQPSR